MCVYACQVGDDTKANSALAAQLALALRYTHIETARLLEQSTGLAPEAIAAADGATGLALAEAMVLESLCTFARCAVATLGEGAGAAARSACWRHLYGGITVWLDVQQPAGGAAAAAPQREAYAEAEVQVAAPAGGAGVVGAEPVLEAVAKLLAADEHLVGKKSLYIRLGARGDWPNLAEPSADYVPPLGGDAGRPPAGASGEEPPPAAASAR